MKKNGGDGRDGMHSYAKQLSKRRERESEKKKRTEKSDSVSFILDI
jgi:hypothetical protein